MISLSLLTAFFLAFVLGQNNLSHLFGPAIGTRMLSFKTSIGWACLFVILGAFISGQATADSVNGLGLLINPKDVFAVCLSGGLVMFFLSRLGIPASITLTSTGALVGWNLFYHQQINTSLLVQMVSAWIYTPIIAGVFAFIAFKGCLVLLKRYPIRLLLRDHFVRSGLFVIGSFSAYALGANNIGSIVGPFLHLDFERFDLLFLGAGCAVAVGFLFADRQVIQTVSKGMFPLSPSEALIVMLISSLTLFLFSSIELKEILIKLSLPVFPLVPVPLSGIVIGAILGIALAKGVNGLKFKSAGRVVCSWVTAPVLSGIICYGVLSCFMAGGIE